MRRRLFEDLLGSAQTRTRTRGALTLPISLLLHVVAVAALVVLPLLAQEPLPPPGIRVFAPPEIPVVSPPPAARPGQQKAAPNEAGRKPPKPEAPQPFVAPTIDPETLLADDDVVLDPAGEEDGIIGSTGTGSEGDGWQPLVSVPDPPDTTPVVLQGTTIEKPRKLHHVAPVYPPLAIQARLQGVVVLDCTINPLGQVVDIKVVSGPPLLSPAAVEAVRQWLYTPTTLNGAPVAVVLMVEVGFVLR
jgi:periplasmic protein TonB